MKPTTATTIEFELSESYYNSFYDDFSRFVSRYKKVQIPFVWAAAVLSLALFAFTDLACVATMLAILAVSIAFDYYLARKKWLSKRRANHGQRVKILLDESGLEIDKRRIFYQDLSLVKATHGIFLRTKDKMAIYILHENLKDLDPFALEDLTQKP
ncbi:MAG: hypothetical protein ACTTIC_07800 [Helicobacteraceae bacterium]